MPFPIFAQRPLSQKTTEIIRKLPQTKNPSFTHLLAPTPTDLPPSSELVKDIFPQFFKIFPTSIFHILIDLSTETNLHFLLDTFTRDLPGGPVVKTFPFNAGNVGWFPGHGVKSYIPQGQN